MRPSASGSRLAAAAFFVFASGALAASGQLLFVAGATHGVPGDARSIAVADFDLDGLDDVAVVSLGDGMNYLSLLRSRGADGFDPPISGEYPGAYKVFAGDFNEDGLPDLLIGHWIVPNVALRLHLGDGNFGFGSPFVNPSKKDIVSGEVVDVDADGHLDLLHVDTLRILVHYGDGSGALAPAYQLEYRADSTIERAFCRDTDGDAYRDIVFFERGNFFDELQVCRSDGRRGFDFPILAAALPVDSRDFSLLRDVTGDGIEDVLVLDGWNSWPVPYWKVLRRRADGTVDAPDDAGLRGYEFTNPVVADFDLDLVPDIVGTGEWGGLLAFRGDGAGRFESQSGSVSLGSGARTAVAFLDRDQLPDLVAITGARDVRPIFNRAVLPCDRGTSGDVLFVNDSTGGPLRRVSLLSFEPLTIFMASPAAATGPSPFALFAWAGPPDAGDARPMPHGIGVACRPMLAAHGEPRPRAIWNNTGTAALGVPTFPSSPAPSVVFSRPPGLGRRVTFFLQGVIADPGSRGTKPASVTNGIVVEVN